MALDFFLIKKKKKGKSLSIMYFYPASNQAKRRMVCWDRGRIYSVASVLK